MLRPGWLLICLADLPVIPGGRHNVACPEIGFQVGNAVRRRSSEMVI